MDEIRVTLGRYLYRIFLLSVLFGILWTKGYLWTVFVFALLLYLFETILKPILELEAARRFDLEPEPLSEPEPHTEPEPPPRRRGGRTRWKWTPEDPS